MKNNLIKQAKIVFIIGVVLIAIAPFLLTRSFGLINFTATGQIGDTIGGITAPLASLLGSILIFFAFRRRSKPIKLFRTR